MDQLFQVIDWFTQPSDVHWCEPKYSVTPHFAEFWNTLTGVPYVLLALWGFTHSRGLKRLLWVQVAFIGIGTSAFHGTLTLGGQLLDEISIVLFLATAGSALLQLRLLYSRLIHLGLVTCMLVHPPTNCYALFGVGILVVGPMTYRFYYVENFRLRVKIFTMCVLTIGGIICWCLDKFDCAGNGYLHAIWHLIMVFVAWLVIESLYTPVDIRPLIKVRVV